MHHQNATDLKPVKPISVGPSSRFLSSPNRPSRKAVAPFFSSWAESATSPRSNELQLEYIRLRDSIINITSSETTVDAVEDNINGGFDGHEEKEAHTDYDDGQGTIREALPPTINANIEAEDQSQLTFGTPNIMPSEMGVSQTASTIPFEAKHACMFRRAARQLKFGNPAFMNVHESAPLRRLGNTEINKLDYLRTKHVTKQYSFDQDISPFFRKTVLQTAQSRAPSNSDSESIRSDTSNVTISKSTIAAVGATNSSLVFQALRLASTNRADLCGGLHHAACVAYVKACDGLHISPLPILDYLNDNLQDIGGRHRTKLEESEGQCHLIMPSYGIGDRGGIALAAFLSNLSLALHEIDVSLNGLKDSALVALFEGFRQNRDLIRINVSSNQFGPKSSQALLKYMPFATSLTDLDVSDCKLRSHTLDKLLSIFAVNSTSIRRMKFAQNDLSKSGEALSQLLEANLTNLSSLDISWTNIAAKEALLVARALKKNNSLRVLDLSMNHFGDIFACDALCSSLKQNQTLTELNLAYNVLTEASAHILAKKLFAGQSSLTRCDISGNTLGEDGFEDIIVQLAKHPHTLQIPMLQCSFEAGKTQLEEESANNNLVVEKSSDPCSFNYDFPDGNYQLDLSLPSARIVAIQLQKLSIDHQAVPGRCCLQNIKYNKKGPTDVGYKKGDFKPFKLPLTMLVKRGEGVAEVLKVEDADHHIPMKGILTFDYAMQKPRKAEKLQDDFVERFWALLNETQAGDPRLARAMVIAVARYFSFTAKQARRFIDMFRDDTATKIRIMKAFSAKIVDKENMSEIMDCLNALEQRQARRHLGTYFYFNPLNATGAYRLDLSDRYDRLLAVELTHHNRQERAIIIKEERPDLSQYNNFEFFRNVKYHEVGKGRAKRIMKTKEFRYTNEYILPSSGFFECDYVSPIRPPDYAEAIEDAAFEAFVDIYVKLEGATTMKCAEEMNEEELRDIFNIIDADGGGSLDAGEIRQAFASLGHKVSMIEIKNLIREVDRKEEVGEVEDTKNEKEEDEDDDFIMQQLNTRLQVGDEEVNSEIGDGEVDFEEFRDLWNLFNLELAKKDRLSLLRNQSILHWFSASQIGKIVSFFDSPRDRVEAFVIFYGRLLDEENMHEALAPIGGPLSRPRPSVPDLRTSVGKQRLQEITGQTETGSGTTATDDGPSGGTKSSKEEEARELRVVEKYGSELQKWTRRVKKPWLKQRKMELDALLKRLGPLALLNPCRPDGDYDLDLRQFDQRLVARIIVRISSAEGVGNVLQDETYNNMGFSSSKWSEKGEPPLIGRWKFTFKTVSRFCRMDERMKVSQEFLGWEFPEEMPNGP